MVVSVYPQILKDFDVAVNGVGNLGKVKEVTLPTVKFKTVTIDNGGGAGEYDIPVNLDKLEAEISFGDIDPIKMGLIGSVDFLTSGTLFTFRGSIKDGPAEIPVVAALGGSIIEIPIDTKKGEEIKSTYKMSVTHYDLIVGGAPVFNIDKLLNIVAIGGVDRNLQTKINIGG